MRLGRAILLLALVLGLAWLAMQVVSINSDDEAIELRVDKQKLRDAGHEAAEQGRRAVEKTEELLHKAGDKIHPSPVEPPTAASDTIQPGETIRGTGTPASP